MPYPIHAILTDNPVSEVEGGIHFSEQPRNRNTAWSRQMRFDMDLRSERHRAPAHQPNHRWTNGQVERMNRTIKEATVKCFHYESHEQLRRRPWFETYSQHDRHDLAVFVSVIDACAVVSFATTGLTPGWSNHRSLSSNGDCRAAIGST